MIIRKRTPLLFHLIIISLILVNCSPISAQYHNAPTSLETPIYSTSIPTSSRIPETLATGRPLPSYTPFITILSGQEQYLAELLNSDKCDLPCYLGVLPGKTSWVKTQDILKMIGANYVGIYSENGLPIYHYSTNIGDSKTPYITPDTKTNSGDLVIAQDLNFTVSDDLVQRIYITVDTQRLAEKYYQYWSKYSLNGVFNRIGQPNDVFLGINNSGDGYAIFVVYEKLGTVLLYNEIKTGNSICPLQPDKNQLSMEMTLTNKAALSSLYAPGKVLPTNSNVYLPIEEALGINAVEFYNRLHSNPSACFDIKKSI